MSLTKKELFPEEGPFLISNHYVIADVIHTAILCKTWPTLPRKIDVIVNQVTALCEREFERFDDSFYTKEFASYSELYEWCKEHILAIPEIEELNLSQDEFDAGVKVEDDTRERFSFCSRFSSPSPKADDFIDLDAFVRNLCHQLIRDKVEINFSSFTKGE